MKARGSAAAIVNAVKALLVIALLAGALSGCAGKAAGPAAPVFFPPYPDEPHIQYLMGITDSTDIEGKATGFSLVLTGSEKGGFIKKIGKAYGITAGNGKLYVCDSAAGQIIVIDLVKKTFDFLKGNVGRGALRKPIKAALDSEGYLYVADPGKQEIVVYNPEGDFERAFGKELGGNIVDVARYGAYLYALDNKTNEIRVLDRKSGAQLRSIGKGSDPKKSVAFASNFTIDSQGIIYVSNIGMGNVIKFDIDGNFLKSFGNFGDMPGEFARPRGIAVDDAGRIYVVDAAFGNVQVFNKDDRMLGFFGLPGLPRGSLNLPAGIAVTKDNLPYFQKLAAPGFQLENVIFVVNQYTSSVNPVISVYGLGEMQGKKTQELLATQANTPEKQ